jgi:putative ABC transport system permease protein
MPALARDVRYAFRTLRRQPMVTSVAVLSLGLGIGANTTIFTVINAVFLTTIPVEEPARLARVHTIDWEAPESLTGISFPNYEDVRDGNTTFEGMACYTTSGVNLIPEGEGGEARQITARHVTGNYFDVLGVRAVLGRTFLPEEDRAPTPVVVLSYGIWERQFGADPSILGHNINLSGHPFEVIGVTPRGFKGLQTIGDPDLVWIPLSMRRLMLTGRVAQYFELRRARFAQTIGRLKPGVTVEQANGEIHALGQRLEEEYPTDNRARELVVRQFSTINPNQRDQYARIGVLLMSVVGVVLLIACANAANLLLAKGADREKEIAIRVAMGAVRGRLVRQLLTESVILAIVAGAFGVLIALWGRNVLWSFRPPTFAAQSVDLSIDPTVLWFTLAVAVATGVVFGLVPAIHASNPDLRGALQEGGRRSVAGTKGNLMRNSLVVVEIALAMVSLIGAGLFLRSLRNVEAVDPGFESERLVLFNLNLGNAGYAPGDADQFHRRMIERLTAIPGVEAAAISSGRMLGGGLPHTTYPEGVDIAGGRGLHVHDIVVSPEYFETAVIPLKLGRLLNDFDRENTHKVAVINEATRRLFWPDTDPIGRRFSRSVELFPIEVVGVVADALIDLAEAPRPIIYTAVGQFPQSSFQVLVRTSDDPTASLPAIQGAIRELDPNLPVLGLTTIGDAIEEALWAPRMGAGLLGVFGVLALLLAMVGIYGVMSYSVRQRHHEIGLRMALGAGQSRVLALVLKHGMTLVGFGILLGVGLGIAATRLIQTMLFGVRTVDPVTFTVVPVILCVVALLANLGPAWRVTRIDPLVAIRDEY